MQIIINKLILINLNYIINALNKKLILKKLNLNGLNIIPSLDNYNQSISLILGLNASFNVNQISVKQVKGKQTHTNIKHRKNTYNLKLNLL